MTEEDARQAVKDFRAWYPELASMWNDTECLSIYENPQFRVPKVRDVQATAPNEPEPSGKPSSIDSRIFSWGAASALTVLLMIVWTEFGLLALAGTFLLVAVALLVWAVQKFEDMRKDETFE